MNNNYFYFSIGGNVFILEMWKDKSPPYMQLVHFMFAFGACITPLFAEPFIKSTPVADNYTAVESLLFSFFFDSKLWI